MQLLFWRLQFVTFIFLIWKVHKLEIIEKYYFTQRVIQIAQNLLFFRYVIVLFLKEVFTETWWGAKSLFSASESSRLPRSWNCDNYANSWRVTIIERMETLENYFIFFSFFFKPATFFVKAAVHHILTGGVEKYRFSQISRYNTIIAKVIFDYFF